MAHLCTAPVVTECSHGSTRCYKSAWCQWSSIAANLGSWKIDKVWVHAQQGVYLAKTCNSSQELCSLIGFDIRHPTIFRNVWRHGWCLSCRQQILLHAERTCKRRTQSLWCWGMCCLQQRSRNCQTAVVSHQFAPWLGGKALSSLLKEKGASVLSGILREEVWFLLSKGLTYHSSALGRSIPLRHWASWEDCFGWTYPFTLRTWSCYHPSTGNNLLVG